ncbi:MAG TPA: hypothetical protein VKA30_13040, partial [Actinomycetota bacterium]|nr:hypothetical protein [Actinomycetota bacterium]
MVFALLASGAPAAVASSAAPGAGLAATSEQDLAAGSWRFRTGDDRSWAEPGFDDAGWKPIRVGQGLFGIGGGWGEQGHPGDYGFGWYRTAFVVHANVSRKARIVLHLDHPTEDVWTYLNGRLIGSTVAGPQDIDLRREWLDPHRNILAVRVLCHGNEHFEAPRYESCGLTDGISLEGSTTTRMDVPLRVSTDRIGNVTEPDVPITFTADVINTTSRARSFTIEFRARYRYGPSGGTLDERHDLALSPGEAGMARAAFTSARR